MPQFSLPIHAAIQGQTQAEGKGGPGPHWVQKKNFLVYKIFIKKAWALWFLAWAPLTHPYPSRPAQEFSRAHENLYIYIYIYINPAVSKTPKPNRKAETKEKKKKRKENKERGESETKKVRDPSRRDRK